MAISPQQNERLFRYLNDSLTPEEEETFVTELNENEELQKAFDLELLLRAAGKTAAETEGEPAANPEFESAAEHLEKAKEMLRPFRRVQASGPEQSRPAKVVPLRASYVKIVSVAAVLILILTASVFYLNWRGKKTLSVSDPPKTKEVVMPQKDSGLAQRPQVLTDTGKKMAPATAVNTQKIFKKHYTVYESTGEDPPEASNEYNAYALDKDYDAVLKKSEDGYGTKGAADSLPGLYLRFYKALSWLATGNPAKAATVLDSLRRHTAPSLLLHSSAQWYLALAYLKQGNAAAARKEAKHLAEAKKASPYRARADALRAALKP